MSSGDPISKSGCTALSAARLALPISRALGSPAARRFGMRILIEAQFFVPSAERARGERMPPMVVDHILDAGVQCAEGLVRR